MLLITSCAPAPAVPPTAEHQHAVEDAYSVGETVRFDDNTRVAIFATGDGKATATASGAMLGQRLESYSVVVENRSGKTLDLANARLELHYSQAGTTYEAPLVIDGANDKYSQVTATLPSPISNDSSSTGTWLFAVPANRQDVSLELHLNQNLEPVIFRN